VPGELCIAGDGVALGYWNQPKLTAERFIPDPFSLTPGATLYQTGDLARYQPDGKLELLGRLDHQIKIRGFRIELGEIETVLEQHPGVGQSVVMVRQDEGGNSRLVVYLVARQKQTPTSAQLRDFLKERLPEYMVPSVFVFLDALPLNPNGKINR